MLSVSIYLTSQVFLLVAAFASPSNNPKVINAPTGILIAAHGTKPAGKIGISQIAPVERISRTAAKTHNVSVKPTPIASASYSQSIFAGAGLSPANDNAVDDNQWNIRPKYLTHPGSECLQEQIRYCNKSCYRQCKHQDSQMRLEEVSHQADDNVAAEQHKDDTKPHS